MNPLSSYVVAGLGKQLAEARKQIPAEERIRIAKAAVAKREEYRRERGKQT